MASQYLYLAPHFRFGVRLTSSIDLDQLESAWTDSLGVGDKVDVGGGVRPVLLSTFPSGVVSNGEVAGAGLLPHRAVCFSVGADVILTTAMRRGSNTQCSSSPELTMPQLAGIQAES